MSAAQPAALFLRPPLTPAFQACHKGPLCGIFHMLGPQARAHLFDDLLLLDEERAHDAVLDDRVAEVASVDAVHCLRGPRQPPVAHLLGPQRGDLHNSIILEPRLEIALRCLPSCD